MVRDSFPRRVQRNDRCSYLARVRPMPLSANLGTEADSQSRVSLSVVWGRTLLCPEATLWLLCGEESLPEHGFAEGSGIFQVPSHPACVQWLPAWSFCNGHNGQMLKALEGTPSSVSPDCANPAPSWDSNLGATRLWATLKESAGSQKVHPFQQGVHSLSLWGPEPPAHQSPDSPGPGILQRILAWTPYFLSLASCTVIFQVSVGLF